MTEPEREMKAVDAKLKSETCHCGAVPILNYDGATSIICPRCGTQAVHPDFNPFACLDEWRRKTN